ncbi:MAG TPA: hypothetical protein VGT81_07285 [Casimicrobiaceae bacterium]|nr:hypothetical protein [Casimicrobiaceae bacterium]
MAIGCTLATVATAAVDDKAKAVVEAPSKAAADPTATAAPPTATVAPPAATAEADTTEAKPDSSERKRGRHRSPRVRIGDDDFESFNEALHTAPWVVGLAFLVAGSILLTPVFLLIGIIWYKLRKTRLQNEAVLQLAERGAMAPARAVDAVMSGVTPEAAVASTAAPLAGSAAAPVYQQAVIARRRAVWSDMRKGVILTAVGLSFVFYSMVENGSANWLGLVLMFLGLGYILLWWFEDRHLQRRETGAEVGVDIGKS